MEYEFEDLIERWASDDMTMVRTLDLGCMKQVIEIEYKTYNLRHYEGVRYYTGFEDIFRDNYAMPLIEAIDDYDYFIYEDYPWLAKWLFENFDKCLGDDDNSNYIRYVAQWWDEHQEGNPACFYEWQDLEGAE